MIRYIAVILFLAVAVSGIAQDSLDFETALLNTLSNNHLIRIASNDAEVAEEQAVMGRAGLLPTVNAEGSVNYGINNTKIQVANSPDVIETTGAQSNSVRASVNLNYTLFSGFANKYSYERLLNSVDVANQQELVTAENIILQAANAYFNILRAKANMEAVAASLNASLRRYEYAEANYELSGGSSLEMLSAKVDLNQDSTLYLNAEAAYLESIYTLNQLMGVEVNSSYSFRDIDEKNRELLLNPLLDDAFAQNSQLQNNRLLEEQSILNYRIAKSAYLPRLNLNSSYSYSSSNTEGSFLVLNQSNGLSSSLVLSVPIFTGGVNNSNLASAEINQRSATERSLEIKSQLERDVRSAYTNYLNALKIKDMEQRNIVSAEQNFNYTKELYEQGLATSVLFREAQINLLLSRNSLANAKYNAVIAELELLRLSGNLIPALNGE